MAFPSTYTAETVNQLAAALNAQRASSGAKWEGGLGVDKSALYMADELAKSGITDLSQVGQGNGNIINKVTGQPLYSGYGERTGGNIWSGSYEGGGNTGFGVNFDAQGNPIFFTQGASSSTLKDDLLKAAALAAAAYGGYYLFGGEALAGTAASDLAAADIAGGLIPEYGTNAAYSGFMTSAMTPEAIASMEALVASNPEIIGSGSVLTDTAAAVSNPTAMGSATAATTGNTMLDSLTNSTGLTTAQLANLAKAGINVAGLLGATNAISNMGGNTSTAAPITYLGGGAGGYSPEYFSQVQSTYNQLMPGVPRDVASPLQQWYSTEFNPGASITGSLFGDMVGGATGAMAPNTGVKPVTTPVVKPVTTLPPTVKPPVVVVPPTTTTTTPVVPVGSTAYQWATNQGGMTPNQYLNNINQWVLDNPNASLADINAIKSTLGVSDVDVQTALGASNFSDATKYALTHDMGLADVNQNIVNWIEQNPTATNAQIQAEQAKYGVSDADIARALTEQNASAAKEYAIIHDMGLDTYYKNIADAAKSGISAADAVAQMKQYGVSPTDVKQAYSMFAPAGGLTLDEVLAAYNK